MPSSQRAQDKPNRSLYSGCFLISFTGATCAVYCGQRLHEPVWLSVNCYLISRFLSCARSYLDYFLGKQPTAELSVLGKSFFISYRMQRLAAISTTLGCAGAERFFARAFGLWKKKKWKNRKMKKRLEIKNRKSESVKFACWGWIFFFVIVLSIVSCGWAPWAKSAH